VSFKSYGKKSVKAAKQGRDFIAYKGEVPTKGKFKLINPWWNRQRHPGWAAYHANKDKK
jgi:hypothetical protein